ncbi:MAG: helix-turn-helix transcriptional regulator [Fibrobacteres bacterium]|nr:helix-turn-helix transcriptional regulator [Fibrobacterota bacterium]
MIGTHLKDIRQKKGWTQLYLSQVSGIRQGELTYYEKNLRNPTAPKLAALAKALSVPMEALVEGADQIPALQEIPAEQFVHGNSTTAQLQKIASQLNPEHQRNLLHHAKLLMMAQENEQALKLKSSPRNSKKVA